MGTDMDVVAPDLSAEAASLREEVSETASQAVQRSLAARPAGSAASVSLLCAAAALPHFKTPIFEGPLDLLLHLIRINEVDIYDIPIAEITGQYLAYMELLEELDLAVAGEYVVMAATLIEIKSRDR